MLLSWSKLETNFYPQIIYFAFWPKCIDLLYRYHFLHADKRNEMFLMKMKFKSVLESFLTCWLTVFGSFSECCKLLSHFNSKQYFVKNNQTLTMPSSPAEAIHFPSGLNLTQLTPFLWPFLINKTLSTCMSNSSTSFNNQNVVSLELQIAS